MPPADAPTVRAGAAPRARALLYRSLARAIAASRPGAGAVLESVWPEAEPTITVRPSGLADLLRSATEGATGAPPWAATPAAPEPPPDSRDMIGVVVPRAAANDDLRLLGDPPRLGPLLGPSGWLAIQTFWVRGPSGPLFAARRFRFAAPDRAELRARRDSVGAAIAGEWATSIGVLSETRSAGPGSGWCWRRRSLRTLPPESWIVRTAAAIPATAEWGGSARPPATRRPSGHAVVFGSSGAGKTTYLAHRAAEAAARGDGVVVLDLHGDLAPAVLERLGPGEVSRAVAVDAGDRPVPGIAVLAGADDRSAALLVAGLKRLTADGSDVYWGFRLERIFDTFVRLVQETGGSLLDLYDLLTREERRDAARLATGRPELARFLEELGPVVRRNPDFLWSAATRISKVALVPALTELLAPIDGGLPVERILGERRALLVRLPVARLGPEAASLAGTLVLARVFLGLAAAAGERETPVPPVQVVLDEVQAFSPRLVAEVLAESRKFGLRVLLATQYPERLAPELRSAAAGAAAEFVAFRVPPPASADAGAWLGMDASTAARLLPALPTGRGIALDPESGELVSVEAVPPMRAGPGPEWTTAIERTRAHAPGVTAPADRLGEDLAVERLLLAVLGAEEEGVGLASDAAVSAAERLPGPPIDSARLGDAWRTIRRRGWVEDEGPIVRLSASGGRALGLSTETGATRESAEHRRLLVRAFRIFARRGYRLEILRQGRFDTTLPDARFAQLPRTFAALPPAALAVAIDRARAGWAWRYFHGRDVHVEAEVSGALRSDRLRRGWAKAEVRGVALLFVVGDARRARRVREFLGRAGIPRDRGLVWTLAEPGRPPAQS